MIIGSNAGHTKSGVGSGAVGFLSESICTRQINNYFIKGIENLKKHRVIDCTIDYSENYLKECVSKANSQNLDYAISHHLNHSNDPNSNGVEVWVYDINDKATYKIADNICSEISKLGFKNRGVKENKNFYWLKNTKSKALIIEYFFCSNKKESSLYNPEKLANSCINGLLLIPNVVTSTDNTKYTYVNGDYDTRAIVVNTNNKGLNVRESRGCDSLVISRLMEGQEITVNYCLNNWFSIYVKGKLGYVCGEYIKLI